MTALLLAMVLLAGPRAGLVETLSPSEAHFALCQAAARDAGTDARRRLGIWKACLDEADRRALVDVVPVIRGSLALVSAEVEALDTPGLAPDEVLERMLASVAEQRGVEFRLQTLAPVFRTYVESHRGRSRMGPWRDFSVRWQPPPVAALREAADIAVRRGLEDAGFRWADFGTEAGSQADVLVVGEVRATLRPDTDFLGPVLTTTEVVLAIESVRVRGGPVPVELPGFLIAASGTGVSEEEARAAALAQAGERLAASLLHRVIRVAFADYRWPEDPADPQTL